jgi:hypothetical protein
MTYEFATEGNRPIEPRQVLMDDLNAAPDLNRHIAIAWTRLAGNDRARTPSRVTVLKPIAF